MKRKTVIVADPGIDAAFAIALALLDSSLEVVGLIATAGNVGPEQATRNTLVVVEQIDPPRWPRVGAALPIRYEVDATKFHGRNGLGGLNFPCVELAHMPLGDKLLADLLRQHPREISALVLGPSTVLARAFDYLPDLPHLFERIVLAGGTRHEPGNATAVAEFNFYCDPVAVRTVLQCGAPIVQVPLDISRKLVFSPAELPKLPSAHTRVGKFLRQLLPAALAPAASLYGVEGVPLGSVVALVALARPELMTLKPMVVDVETRGELTMGAAVFDMRWGMGHRSNVDLVVDADWAGVREYIREWLSEAEVRQEESNHEEHE